MKKIIIATIVWFLTMGIVSHAQEATIIPDHFLKLSPEDKEIGQSYMPMYCVSKEPFLSELTDKFGETVVFVSQSHNALGEVLLHLFYANPESETWSFLVSNEVRNTVCIIASGEGFLNVAAPGAAL